MGARGRPRTAAAFESEATLRPARESKAAHIEALQGEIERETDVARRMLADSRIVFEQAKLDPLRRALAVATREMAVMDARLGRYAEERQEALERERAAAIAGCAPWLGQLDRLVRAFAHDANGRGTVAFALEQALARRHPETEMRAGSANPGDADTASAFTPDADLPAADAGVPS